MNLRVLGSGSSGNCYLLEDDTECLVIEAGLPFREVKVALDFDVSKIVGVICSHVHGDHHRYSHQYERAGYRVLKPFERDTDRGAVLGNFLINSFPLQHDVDCYGFMIWHPTTGRVLYITDTEYVKWTFKNTPVTTMLVEANYDREMLDKEELKADHVLLSHMEIGTTCDFIRENQTEHLQHIILCHLSSTGARYSGFKDRVEEIFDGDVQIARKGLCVNIDERGE